MEGPSFIQKQQYNKNTTMFSINNIINNQHVINMRNYNYMERAEAAPNHPITV